MILACVWVDEALVEEALEFEHVWVFLDSEGSNNELEFCLHCGVYKSTAWQGQPWSSSVREVRYYRYKPFLVWKAAPTCFVSTPDTLTDPCVCKTT